MAALYFPLLISIGSFIICLFTFVYLRSYIKRKTEIKSIKDGLISDIREEITQLLSTMDETTERDISLIEERKKELKEFLSSIDASINDMEKRLKLFLRESEMRENSAALSGALQSSTMQEEYQNLGKMRHKAGATFPIPEFIVKEEEKRENAPITEQIKELLMAGFSPAVIASRLGISIAEAEFAAALYEGKNAITGT